MLEARVNFIIKELYNDDEDILNITWEKCTMPKETHDINQHKGNYNPYQGSFAHVSTHPSIRYTAQTILTNVYQVIISIHMPLQMTHRSTDSVTRQMLLR